MKRNHKPTPFDPAEALTSTKAIAVFMKEAFASEDAGYIAHALGVAARATGMAQIARETGLSREQLYRSFSDTGNPTLETTIAVMKSLGIELTAKVRTTETRARFSGEHKEDGMFTITYMETRGVTHQDFWRGALARAQDVARNAVDSGGWKRVEIRNDAGELIFHYPRVMRPA